MYFFLNCRNYLYFEYLIIKSMHNFANKKKSKKNKEARSLANSFDF